MILHYHKRFKIFYNMVVSNIFIFIFMDIKQLNNDLQAIVEARIALNALNYNDEQYDEVEEHLHDLEDDFLELYSDYLEDILFDIHEQYCPDNEVLLPLSYIAKVYLPLPEKNNTKQYDVAEDQGVWIEIEELPEGEAHLAFIPNPLRVVLTGHNNFKKVVWIGK
jgi:hypothetical protein